MTATMWSAVAPGWAEHADYVDSRSAALTEELLAVLRPGDRVLELACGAGGLGIAAAERGHDVVLSDVAPEMAAIAAERAAGLPVTTLVLDLDRIDLPDGSFDAVLCREGLMFAADHRGAGREIARVLVPRGRVAVAVWGARERNPWLGLVLDAVSAELGHPVPPPGIPGPFALSDPGDLRRALADFADVRVREFAVPLRAGSFDEWWSRTTALAGPLARILASLSDAAGEAIRARARDAVRPYEASGGLELPGVSLLYTGRRA
jgi:enediyne biosynthesis protein CalE5